MHKAKFFFFKKMRNRIFEENRAIICQELEELRNLLRRNTWSPIANRRIVCAAGKESFYCESALDSDSGFAEQSTFLDRHEFYDPERASSSGVAHVPSQPLTVSMSTSRNVVESLLAREGPPSALFQNSKNVASSSCGLGSRNTMEHARV